MRALVSSLCAAAALVTSAAAQTPPAGDAVRGEALYVARCSACHSLDANRIGPLHRGVVGRRAASVPGFAYSQALQRRNVTWTEANLDAWLANPTAFAPGTAMGVRVPVAQERVDIIAYLRANPAR